MPISKMSVICKLNSDHFSAFNSCLSIWSLFISDAWEAVELTPKRVDSASHTPAQPKWTRARALLL